MKPPRRVVTGLDAQGRSCVIIDGAADTQIWSTADAVADNGGTADAGGGAVIFPTAGTQFIYADFAPGMTSPMHATNTIDYICILAGECVLVTETGETHLRAGDVFVDRGILHAWRNDGDEPCRIVSVLCPSKPLGDGPIMSGEMPSPKG
jgi:quercetin dioxygenase-like cupin family protein